MPFRAAGGSARAAIQMSPARPSDVRCRGRGHRAAGHVPRRPLKDGNLQASCVVRSEQNGIENMRLDVAGTKTDENGLTVLFGADAEDEWRFPFDDMQTALSFIVTTEESTEDGLQRKSDFYVALDDALKPVRA